MILFVFEGEKREIDIFNTLQTLFFQNKKEQITVSYKNNIYNLFDQMQNDVIPNQLDITTLLKKTNPELEQYDPENFSEIYLFFDYDCQDDKADNKKIGGMLQYFNDESDKGKLYINYPMVESLFYVKKLPDKNFYDYVIPITECTNFKKIVHEFCDYGNANFCLIDKKETKERIDEARQNWAHLNKMNIEKAHFLVFAKKSVPEIKSEISQDKIFSAQITNFVPAGTIAILNTFPLFLYDYFGDSLHFL